MNSSVTNLETILRQDARAPLWLAEVTLEDERLVVMVHCGRVPPRRSIPRQFEGRDVLILEKPAQWRDVSESNPISIGAGAEFDAAERKSETDMLTIAILAMAAGLALILTGKRA